MPYAHTRFAQRAAFSGAVVFALMVRGLGARGNDVDSLAYTILRDRLVERRAELPAEYGAYLDAAGDLAAAGLYAEAFAVLDAVGEDTAGADTAVSDTTRGRLSRMLDGLEAGDRDRPAGASAAGEGAYRGAAPRPAGREAPSISWRARLGGGYDRYSEEIDYGAIDSAGSWKLDSFAYDFDDRPWSASIRLGADLRNPVRFMDALEPSLHVSDSRYRAGARASGVIAGRALRYSLEAEGELKRGESYGDSSDAITLAARLDPSSERWTGRVWLEAPGEVRMTRYRHNRSLYISFTEFNLAPEIGAMLDEGGSRAALGWRFHSTGYAPAGQTDNAYRHGPAAALDVFGRRMIASASVSALRERRPEDPAMQMSDKLECHASWSARLAPLFEPHIRLWALLEREQRRNDTVAIVVRTVDGDDYDDRIATYWLQGRSLDCTPSVRMNMTGQWHVEPSVRIEIYDFPAIASIDGSRLLAPLSLWESSTKWEPAIALGCAYRRVNARVAGGYRIENAAEDGYAQDARGFAGEGSASWSLASWLRIDISASYQRLSLESETSESDLYVDCYATVSF
jgi:hypothetical protein